jgi:hypothetical protein
MGLNFGPPKIDQQKLYDQLVAQGVPSDVALHMVQRMAGSIDGITQTGENKVLNTALPIAGAVAGGLGVAGAVAGAAGTAGNSGTDGSDSGSGNGPGDTPDVGNTNPPDGGTPSSGNSGSSGGGSSGINWGSLASSLGSDVSGFLKNWGGDLLTGLAVYTAAQRQKQANQYAQGALAQEQSLFNDKAPVRALGIAGLENAGAGNPFATRTPAPVTLAGNGPTGPNGTNQTGGTYAGPLPPGIGQGAIQDPAFANGQAPTPAGKAGFGVSGPPTGSGPWPGQVTPGGLMPKVMGIAPPGASAPSAPSSAITNPWAQVAAGTTPGPSQVAPIDTTALIRSMMIAPSY